MSTALELKRGLEEEQKSLLSKEDAEHDRVIAQDQATTLNLQAEDERTRRAIEVRACVCVSARRVFLYISMYQVYTSMIFKLLQRVNLRSITIRDPNPKGVAVDAYASPY